MGYQTYYLVACVAHLRCSLRFSSSSFVSGRFLSADLDLFLCFFFCDLDLCFFLAGELLLLESLELRPAL